MENELPLIYSSLSLIVSLWGFFQFDVNERRSYGGQIIVSALEGRKAAYNYWVSTQMATTRRHLT